MRVRLLLVLGLLAASSAHALELRRAFDDVVKDADRVVHGEITHVESAWVTRDGGHHIVTRATFEVKDWYKGGGGPALTLEFPGGTVGSITEWVSDAARPQVGAELVLALDAADRVPPATSRVFPVEKGRVGGLGGDMPVERFAATVRAVLNHETPPLAGEPHPALRVATAPRDVRVPGERVATHAALETIMTEGFEGAFPPPGWSVTGGTPQWGPTEWTASSGSRSAWSAGTPPGLSPADNSPVVPHTRLIYGPFDLRGASDAYVTFRYRWPRAGGQQFYASTSTDGVNFSFNLGIGSENDWYDGRMNLGRGSPTDLRGEPAVWIAFEFEDDYGWRQGPGFFLDDVAIVRESNPLPDLVPAEFAVSSTSVVEGDPFEIDVRLLNQGTAAAEPSVVHFQYAYTEPYSWTIELGNVDAPRLEPGQSAWVRYSFRMPHTNLGTYKFRAGACVDWYNAVDEQNERNNRGESDQVVDGRDGGYPLLVSIEPSRASAGTGSVVHFKGSGFAYLSDTVFYVGGGLGSLLGIVQSWAADDVATVVPTGVSNNYPVSAGSGPAYLYSNPYVSAELPFHVTFGYGGYQWDHWRVPWYAGPVLANPGAPAAFAKAATSWNEAGGAFLFEQKTTTETLVANAFDGKNVLAFTPLSGSILAMTGCWIDGTRLVECDITFNSPFPWTAGASTPTPGKVDVETIALHEFGHWLHLRDLYGEGWSLDQVGDTDKVMYGFGDDSFKRTLTPDDADGLRWIYGRLATLYLASRNAQGTIGITITPADLDGASGSAVPRKLLYREGTPVTVTAPATSGSYFFDHWDVPGSAPLPDSTSTFQTAPGANTVTAVYVSPAVRSDADASGRVDGLDLILLSSAFGRSEGEAGYSRAVDFDRNGIVDGNDLALLASSFGKSAR